MSKPQPHRARKAAWRDADIPGLVAAVLADAPDAFDELVSRFQRSAHASAYSLLADPQLAQDAVQEAFLDAYLTLHQLRDPAAFPGWFRRIVFKHADRVRRKPRLPVARFADSDPGETAATPSAEEHVLAAEQGEIVRRALARLPEHERIVASLFYLGDQSHAEICDFLVLPLSTIKKRLHDARRRMRSDLAAFELASRAAVTAPLGAIAAPGPARAAAPPPRAAHPEEEKPMAVSRIVPLLNVRDVSRSIEFYQNALGFECRSSWKDEGRVRWASLASGDVEIMINESGSAASDAEHHAARPTRGNFSDCVLYLRVDDADALYERLQGDGFTTSEIFDADYGLREFHMRDFDGYELSITSPLARGDA